MTLIPADARTDDLRARAFAGSPTDDLSDAARWLWEELRREDPTLGAGDALVTSVVTLRRAMVTSTIVLVAGFLTLTLSVLRVERPARRPRQPRPRPGTRLRPGVRRRRPGLLLTATRPSPAADAADAAGGGRRT